MNEDKSKLQLIGEIAQANNKNLELIEELNNKEEEIERLNNNWQQAIEDLTNIANELGLEEGSTIYDILDKLKELKEGR